MLTEKQKKEIAEHKKNPPSKKDTIQGCAIIVVIIAIIIFCMYQCGSCADDNKAQAKTDSIEKDSIDSADYADNAQIVTRSFISDHLTYSGDDNYSLLCCNKIAPNIYVVNYNFTAKNGFNAEVKMFANAVIHHNPKSKPEDGWELGTLEINAFNGEKQRCRGSYDTDKELDSIDKADPKLKYAGE